MSPKAIKLFLESKMSLATWQIAAIVTASAAVVASVSILVVRRKDENIQVDVSINSE